MTVFLKTIVWLVENQEIYRIRGVTNQVRLNALKWQTKSRKVNFWAEKTAIGQRSASRCVELARKTSDCVTLETKTSFCCSAKLVKYKQTFDMRIATNFRLILSLQCQLKPCRCGSQMWPWHNVFKFWLEKLIHPRILSHRIPLNLLNSTVKLACDVELLIDLAKTVLELSLI